MLKKILGLIVVMAMMSSMAACSGTEAAPVEIPEDKAKAGELFITQISIGDYEAARSMLSPEMQKFLTGRKIKSSWKQLTSNFGPYHHHEMGYFKGQGEYEAAYIKAEFEYRDLGFRLAFDEDNRITSFTIGDYMNPPVLAENEEKFNVTSGKYNLDGILTLPNTEEGTLPPAVILIGGSGPTDMDSTVGPNKPFAQLAQGLSQQGKAVLRYDKRTLVYGASIATEDQQFTVYDEYVEDAKNAFSQLAQSGKVDPERIYIAGHSMGGMMIPMIAQEIPEAAGFAMLSANAQRLEDLIVYQNQYLIDVNQNYSKTQSKSMMKEVRSVAQKVKEAKEDGTGVFFNGSEYYWYDLNQYDQVEQAKDIDRPLLVTQGEKDYQVPMENFTMWQQALEGKSNVTMKTYPEMNHLLMTSDGTMAPAEYQTEGEIVAQLVDDLADFIQ